MDIQTHPKIHLGLCGVPVAMSKGHARVELLTTPEMGVDDRGLVHGGFVFGLVDHAAMLAVNDPLVVLGSAETRFLAPVKVGDLVIATATRREQVGRKHLIDVEARVGDQVVLTGTLTTFVLKEHVLAGRTA